MGSANSYSAKDELLKVARVICDAFDYNPGHSDLDANQPIWIGVTLGDWRKLHFALATIKSESESSGPKCEELLARAVAYLPVPAIISRGGSAYGVKIPDPEQQPAVERLRREILTHLRSTATQHSTASPYDCGGKPTKDYPGE